MKNTYYKHNVLQKKNTRKEPTLAECISRRSSESLATGCLDSSLRHHDKTLQTTITTSINGDIKSFGLCHCAALPSSSHCSQHDTLRLIVIKMTW